MAKFITDGSIADFQTFVLQVYGLPDDRLFSLPDLLTHQQRFTMRALKGIRKGDVKKIKINLMISLSWAAAVANRLHINLEDVIWNRFPALCSYCGHCPCKCKKIKLSKRVKINPQACLKPGTLAGFQKMFAKIYPPKTRSLAEAGIHLAEEMGELSESIHYFFGEHKKSSFPSIVEEIADYVSCIFGVASSRDISLASELAKIYNDNCHVCHKSPCECNFSAVASIHT